MGEILPCVEDRGCPCSWFFTSSFLKASTNFFQDFDSLVPNSFHFRVDAAEDVPTGRGLPAIFQKAEARRLRDPCSTLLLLLDRHQTAR